MKNIQQNATRRKRGVAIIARYSRWYRRYASTRHDAKILGLSDRLYRHWCILLEVAAETEDGILPPVSVLAHELRCTAQEAETSLGDLIDFGLLDIIARAGSALTITPHNWQTRQFKSDHDGAERVRRHRERQIQHAAKDVHACNTTVTRKRALPHNEHPSQHADFPQENACNVTETFLERFRSDSDSTSSTSLPIVDLSSKTPSTKDSYRTQNASERTDADASAHTGPRSPSTPRRRMAPSDFGAGS